MQKTAFTIAVLVVAIAVVSLRGLKRGKEPRRAAQNAEISLKCSPDIAWETGTKFHMQWNDATKKMVFDGPFGWNVIGFSWCQVRSLQRNAEFNFDVGNAFERAVASDSDKSDGRIHYGMEWGHTETEAASSRADLFAVTQGMILWGAHNAEGWSRGHWVNENNRGNGKP